MTSRAEPLTSETGRDRARAAGRLARGAAAVLLAMAACAGWLPATAGAQSGAQSGESWAADRRRMVDDDVAAAGIKDPRVLAAMLATPRHLFVPPDQRANAYYDMALPIGEGQTISPPFVVAYMTEQLEPRPGDRVLEIGTGSGYQAAVLSGLVAEVYTIEIVEPLARRAEAALGRLGYKNVHVRVGDGFVGWAEQAPFDKIIVTCSPEKVPQPLVEQLSEQGRLVIPVGERYQQTLYRYTKRGGKLEAEALEPTMFVPMTGAAERERLVKPDPLRPALVNGGFEKTSPGTDQPPGWYYVRQAAVRPEPDAPQGEHCLTMENRLPGRAARALQAFGIDGRRVPRLKVSLWVRAEGVEAGQTPDQLARVIVHFYDENRAAVGLHELGPWSGDLEWTHEQARFNVPREARLGVLGIGLFGATGQASFDDVRVRPIRTNPSVLPD
ncbi:MAG: protein-L-isoaspartate(D-aspartate) O-methyltransferase [Pirellulales bacterium]